MAHSPRRLRSAQAAASPLCAVPKRAHRPQRVRCARFQKERTGRSASVVRGSSKDRFYRCPDHLLARKQDRLVSLRQGIPPAKRGDRRDGRPDFLPRVIAPPVTTDGFPLAYRVMDGNASSEWGEWTGHPDRGRVTGKARVRSAGAESVGHTTGEDAAEGAARCGENRDNQANLRLGLRSGPTAGPTPGPTANAAPRRHLPRSASSG
jgi:hypothetical protein